MTQNLLATVMGRSPKDCEFRGYFLRKIRLKLPPDERRAWIEQGDIWDTPQGKVLYDEIGESKDTE